MSRVCFAQYQYSKSSQSVAIKEHMKSRRPSAGCVKEKFDARGWTQGEERNVDATRRDTSVGGSARDGYMSEGGDRIVQQD